MSQFNESATHIITQAMHEASKLGHTYIGSEHLLLAFLQENGTEAQHLLIDGGANYDDTLNYVKQIVETGDPVQLTSDDMTPRTRRILQRATQLASQVTGSAEVTPELLLLALLSDASCYGVKLLETQDVSIPNLINELSRTIRSPFSSNDPPFEGSNPTTREPDNSKKSNENAPESLKNFGRDLTAAAKAGKLDPIIGRDNETERVIQILSRRTKNNPCLIGEPGVGKTAVVEGLAQKIVSGDVPDNLKGKTIFTLDLASMVAGAKYRGEFEERFKNIMNDVIKNQNIILFIDEIHTLVGAGAAEGAVDAANILKPALARGEMQLIGATTITEYRKYIEKDAALERRFQSVMVGEPSPEDALLILKGLKDKYEQHHRLTISDEALEAAVKLSVRYISDRFLPDKAIDLIDEAASRLRITKRLNNPNLKKLEETISSVQKEKEEAIGKQEYEQAANLRDKEKELQDQLNDLKNTIAEKTKADKLVVTAADIASVVTQWTSIPVDKLAETESERLLHLEDALKAHVIGQDEAVSAVAKAIRRGRMGLKNPKRPIGSFIFLGKTGVGKTELCKTLAEQLFGDKNAMIRLDMSEYMEKHSVSKLIGSPPGYVGYEEGGQLTEMIRRHPYSVILFDEIEKAHPDVFNILLQVLDDGLLTDSQGRHVDFKNTIIIMTSNIGAVAGVEPKSLGFTATNSTTSDENAARERMLSALKATFRPEFLNRVDDIIVFNQLNEESIQKIASLMIQEVIQRLKALEIELTVDNSVLAFIAKEGFDDQYGARPLRRAIVRYIEDELSTALLDGTVKPGMHIEATMEDNKVTFKTI